MATTKRKAVAGKRAKLPGVRAWAWQHPDGDIGAYTEYTKGEVERRWKRRIPGAAVKVRIVLESELLALMAGGGGK